MANRTRRDLSNPRIKKIVKAQISQSRNTLHHRSPVKKAGNSRSNSWILYLLLVMFAGTVVFWQWGHIQAILAGAWESNPIRKKLITVEEEPAVASPSSSPVSPATEQPQTPPPVPVQQAAIQPVARRIQVEVLNGCGVNGLAETLTRYLRRQNIDVVSQGNYKHFQVPETRILDRIGNRDRAQIVADILGVPTEQIKSQVDPNLQLDATIIIGHDYRMLKPFMK